LAASSRSDDGHDFPSRIHGFELEHGLCNEPQFEELSPTPSSPNSGSTPGRPATDDDFHINPNHDIDFLYSLCEAEAPDTSISIDTSNSTQNATPDSMETSGFVESSNFMQASATNAFNTTFSIEQKVHSFQPDNSPSQEQPTIQPPKVLTTIETIATADIVGDYLVAPPTAVSIHPSPAWSEPVSEPFNIYKTTDANIPVVIEVAPAPLTVYSVPLGQEVTRSTITINKQVDIGNTVSREPIFTGRGKRQNRPAQTNQERCKTYRERNKAKKEDKAKDLLRLTERNTTLKISERVKRAEVARMKQLLKMMGCSV